MRISYGATEAAAVPDSGCFRIRLPVGDLGDGSAEHFPFPGGVASSRGQFVTFEGGGQIAALATVPMDTDLEEATREVYAELFEVIGENKLYRIWNYLPGINDRSGSLELYRQFNIGRWRAFENNFGPGHENHMPAASAVGATGNQMVILALGGTANPLHLENPEQIPAYRYPTEHGPRAPGFARASVVTATGSRIGFLSGTASIVGHRSVGRGDFDRQFDTMIANVETMLRRMGLPPLGTPGVQSQLKCYLRDGADKERALARFRDVCGTPDDLGILFLEADICRRELDLEIEGVFVIPT